MFNIGDHVLIKTMYGGSYNGKTGVVIAKNTNDRNELGKPGSRYCWSCPGWYRVQFDEPVSVGGVIFEEDAFKPGELALIKD